MYPEDQQPRNYSDEEIDNYRKSQNNTEPQPHKHAKPVLILSLILLILIVLGASYYLTNNNESENLPIPVVQKTNDSAEEIETLEQASMSQDWLLFESNEYDIKIPDGWITVHQDNGVLLMSCDSDIDCYELLKGTLASVEEVVGGRDGLQGFLFAIQGDGISLVELTSGYSLDREIVDGYSLYTREITEEPENEYTSAQLPVGTMEYLAVKVLDDDRVSYFSYSVTPAQSDPTNLVTEMIKSLVLK